MSGEPNFIYQNSAKLNPAFIKQLYNKTKDSLNLLQNNHAITQVLRVRFTGNLLSRK